MVISGDGLIGAGRRRAGRHRAPLGILPRRSRQRPRACARHPGRPGGAVGRARGRRDAARSTSARSTAAASSASPAAASTPTPTGSPTRRRFVEGNLVYAYAALRALAAWKPARFTVTRRRRAPRVHRLLGRGREHRAFGGGMFIAPDAELDDGLLDVVTVAERRQAPLPAATCRRSSRARTSTSARCACPARREVAIERRPALRRLRRRRPHRRPAGDGPLLPRALTRDRAAPATAG